MGRDIILTRPKKRKSVSSGPRTLFIYKGIKDKDGNEDFISDIDSEYLGPAKLPGYRQTSGDVVGITEAGERDLIDGDIYKVRYYDLINLDSRMLKDYKRKTVKLEDGTDSYVYVYEPNKIFMEKGSRYMMLYRLLKISSAEKFNSKKIAQDEFNINLVRKCFDMNKRHYPEEGQMGKMTWDFMTSIDEHKVILAYLQYILDKKIEGSIIELGCHNGNTTVMIQKLLELNKSNKEVVVYDTFEGFPDVQNTFDENWGGEGELETSIARFKENLRKNKVDIPKIIRGRFDDIPDSKYPDKIAFAFYDGDLYQSTIDALEKIYHKISPGGVIIFDDYKNPQDGMYPGVKKACEKFFGKNNKVKFIGSGAILGASDDFFNVSEDSVSQAVFMKKEAQGQTESYDIEDLDELMDLINEDGGQLIFLDNPMGSYKKFGGNKKLKLPFDYGEYSELINPADDMGWDIIIVPSASGKYGKTIAADKNDLIPVGLVPVNESESDWEKNTNGKKKPPVGNDKIILAPNGKYLDSDAKEIESFFSDLWQFKEIKWY